MPALSHLRRRAALAVAAAGVLLTAATQIATASPTDGYDPAWSGYTMNIPATSQRSIRVSVTVPSLSCSIFSNSAVSIWAGFGGTLNTNTSLPQAGVRGACRWGKPSYVLWHEWADPKVATTETDVATVHAGDYVIVDVYQLPNLPDMYFALYDIYGAAGGHQQLYWPFRRAAGSTAPVGNTMDAIVEAPCLHGTPEPLANFGRMAVNVSYSINGSPFAENFVSNASTRWTMLDSKGLVKSSIWPDPHMPYVFYADWLGSS